MKTKYYIGTSGWSYEHWVDRFYPQDIKKTDWLKFYSDYFNTVELNMSFYRYPFPNMLKGWKKKLPADFKMTFKANRRISHSQKFNKVKEPLKKFCSLINIMQNKTGCILFQAPPSFKKTERNLKILESFFEQLNQIPPKGRNVIEFRDKSWWVDDTYEILRNYYVCFCCVSGLNMPSDVIVTTNFAYFRFHGPGTAYSSKYSEEQISEWTKKIKKAVKNYKPKEVYCYFNNDFFGYAIENAKKLQEHLNAY